MKCWSCKVDFIRVTSPLLALVLAALSGCSTVAIDGEVPDCLESEIGGHYFFDSFDAGGLGVSEIDFQRDSRTRHLISRGKDSIGLSVKITHTLIRRNVTWPYVLNVFPASFTLTAWPVIVPKDTDRYSIEIVSALGNDVVNVDVEKTRWITLLSPLAFLPVPFVEESVYSIGDPDAVKTATADIAAASKEVARQHVIAAVKSTLRRDRYDAYWAMKREAAEADRRSAVETKRAKEEVAVLNCTDARKEETLRTFALKEAPVMWQTVQDLRREIARMDENINALREELVGFGRDPDSDEDLEQLIKVQSNMKAELVSLYQKLQDACLAAKKYEATPGRKDYEELHRKTIEDGVREAEMVSERFKEMGKNK